MTTNINIWNLVVINAEIITRHWWPYSYKSSIQFSIIIITKPTFIPANFDIMKLQIFWAGRSCPCHTDICLFQSNVERIFQSITGCCLCLVIQNLPINPCHADCKKLKSVLRLRFFTTAENRSRAGPSPPMSLFQNYMYCYDNCIERSGQCNQPAI